MIEVYKMLDGYAPPITENLFEFCENVHNTRKFKVISNKNIKTAKYGLETICHKTIFIWANLDIKLATSLMILKHRSKVGNATHMFLVCIRLSNKA